MILSSGEIWRGNHGNPQVLAKLHWEPTTCDWCLKSGHSWGTESLTCRVYLVSELSWLVGHPVGVHRELIVGGRKHSGAKVSPPPLISNPPYPFLWLSNYSAFLFLYRKYNCKIEVKFSTLPIVIHQYQLLPPSNGSIPNLTKFLLLM